MIVLWVRSYRCAESIQYAHKTTGVVWWCSLFNLRGSLALGYRSFATAAPISDLGWTYGRYHLISARRLAETNNGYWLGFGRTTAWSYQMVLFPQWFLALLFAISPALHLRATIRSRRLHRAGHCPRCGYDLRATPERCPECGDAFGVEVNSR
jgi:hypothetical protein